MCSFRDVPDSRIEVLMSEVFPTDLIVMALPLESQGVFEKAGVPVP